jgi:hypothetical protein
MVYPKASPEIVTCCEVVDDSEKSITLQSLLAPESDQPDPSELMAVSWAEDKTEVNNSLSEPVEKAAPATLIVTGESNPSESEETDRSPELTYELKGTIE